MINIPETLSQLVRAEHPDVTVNFPGNGALLVSKPDGQLMMFKVEGSTLTVPTWVISRDVFKRQYDLTLETELSEFVGNLNYALTT